MMTFSQMNKQLLKQVMLSQFVVRCIHPINVIDLLNMHIKMLSQGLQMYSVTF